MTDRITLTGLKVNARHGVLPTERVQSQPFLIDIDLFLDLRAAARSDALGSTVDYAALAAAVHEVVTRESHHLIETVASKVADEVLADERVDTVRVTVHKPNAPISETLEDVSVTIERSR